jgi:protein N-lysine methyltransferase METTL21A
MAMLANYADLAHEEALDALDPLRHLMAVGLDTSIRDQGDNLTRHQDVLVPPQQAPVIDNTIKLHFPRPGDIPISLHLVVDASPGCGGVAWPAGMVNLFSY